MCGRQLVLALITVYMGCAHSWDIAVSIGNILQFYTNGTKTNTVYFKSLNLTAITYDEVHNMILFVDKQRNHDSICGYSLSSKDIRCFVKRYGSNIHDLAFEPATDLLYFTDAKEQTINWISLSDQESESNVYGNILIRRNDQIPSNIAVDICKGYLYWTNSKRDRRRSDYMERTEPFSSETQVIYRFIPIRTFAIDPQTQKNYFIAGSTYSIFNKVDLRANNFNRHKETILINNDRTTQELAVSKDYIYWVTCKGGYKTVWQILKNASKSSVKPKEFINFYTGATVSIATNYRIKDQVQGLQDCKQIHWPTETTTELYEPTETEQTYQTSYREETKKIFQSSYMEETTEIEEPIGMSTVIDETVEPGQTTELYPSSYPEETTVFYETKETEQTSELYPSSYPEETTVFYETKETEQTSELYPSSYPEETTVFYETKETEQTSELYPSSYPEETTVFYETKETEQTSELYPSSYPEETTVFYETKETEQTSELYPSSYPEETTVFYETKETEQTSELYPSSYPKDTTVLDETTNMERATGLDEKSSTEINEISNKGQTSETGQTAKTEVELEYRCNASYSKTKFNCLNYCFQGDCGYNREGYPVCRCYAGYSGERCEVYACHSYCLNNGECSLNEEDEPECQCDSKYEGSRCEVVKNNTETFTFILQLLNAKVKAADLLSKPIAKIAVIVEV